MRRKVWIGLLLAAATLLIYAPSVRNGFVVLGDLPYVVNNPHVRMGPTPANVRWAFTAVYEGRWHPLTWISHMLDCRLYGPNPAGHHLSNVLLHLLNTLLLFAVLARMTGAAGRSAFVAALFALHPLHVESVVWIAERKDLLGTFFGLLAIGAYARYAGRPGKARYALVVLCYVLGLMSTPMVLTLPFVFLLLDFWPIERSKVRSWTALVAEKLPLMALSLAAVAVAYAALLRGRTVTPVESFPFVCRVANAVAAYGAYVGKMVWPSGLSVCYPHPGSVIEWARVLPSAAMLLATTLLVVFVRRSQPYLLTGWLWCLGTLVPVIGLVQLGGWAMADRYTYVPLVGLFIMIVWSAAEAVSERGRGALGIAGAVIVVALAWQARVQLGYWRSSETLLRRALAVTRDNWPARYALGNALAADGRIDEAIEQYREALRIQPSYLGSRSDMGITLVARAQTDGSLRQYTEVLRLRPDDVKAHIGMAAALLAVDRPEEAMEHYGRALRLDPDSVDALNNLAWMLVTGTAPTPADAERALGYAARAAELTGRRNAVVLDTLAAAQAANGHFDEAVGTAREAAALARDSGRDALAVELEQRLRRYEEKRAWNGSDEGGR
jgi:protein O-mannosyl-transferase